MIVCESARLRLRQLTLDDAGFILELLNEPDFIRNIGDRGVRTPEDARRYLTNGPLANYQHWGFGLYLIETKSAKQSIGICGLLRRDYLQDVDVGFALLAAFRGAGYAFEAAAAAMQFGHRSLGLERIVAITAPDNQPSIKLLLRLGLEFERMVRVPGQDRPSRLFSPRARSLLDSPTHQPEVRR